MIGKLWAIARITIAQGVRMRVAVVIIFFLLVIIPALPFLLQTDETQIGRARIVVSYSLYLTLFLLSILTLFLATATISKEIEQKQIFVLDPKPVRRWEIFLGKWLGIMLLNAVLVAVLGGVCYLLLSYLSRPSLGTAKEYRELKSRFLVARESVKPDLPYDITTKVQEEYDRLVREGLLPANRSKKWVMSRLIPVVARQQNSVPPLTYRRWVFSGMPGGLKSGQVLQFRFKHFVTFRPENGAVEALWQFGERARGAYYVQEKFSCDGFHEFEVPAVLIQRDGALPVYYVNLRAGQPTTIFPFEDGLQVFYPVGSLAVNFLKALLVIFLMLALLAILGLVCGACLSFPVAILVVLSVFLVGISAGFLSNVVERAYLFGQDIREPGAPFSLADRVLQGTLQGILTLFPPLLRFSPVPLVSDARAVSWAMVLKTLGELVLLRGGLIAVLGAYLFHRRELGTTSAQ